MDTGANARRGSAASIVQPTLTTATQIHVKTMGPVLTKSVGTGANVWMGIAASIVQPALTTASQIRVKTMAHALTRSTDTGATVLKDSTASIVQPTSMTAHQALVKMEVGIRSSLCVNLGYYTLTWRSLCGENMSSFKFSQDSTFVRVLETS